MCVFYSERKMFLLTYTLMFICAVVYECHAEQKLRCSYNSKNKGLQRIWCKKDENNQNCCSGFSFNSGENELGSGSLSVQEDDQGFNVSVNSLPQGAGVYWCGLKNGSGTIIKLAEIELHSESAQSPMDLVWSIMRWLLFILLMLSVISTHMCCSRRKAKE
ncbi:hypothetical protein PHYPO_G00143350 [Pangasianodon hypophthalmus]|uniref:Ig-like domain-containing protein n=1 Tax=Pangasianodon hypophthalmus TaxID=310915 RepID=A0A5N5KEG0_PANHP|nr:uncharacterized protein si:ch211-102c2.4 isoform X2 [Pangasianodon hypophthalmus]KAB5528712.1 hypothetical protein PHYPO_G00143350 [Pangasianodon hypophthalmus]